VGKEEMWSCGSLKAGNSGHFGAARIRFFATKFNDAIERSYWALIYKADPNP
jgi:hypothetical protein